MQKRTRAIVLTASLTVAGIALGATIASAADGSSPKVPALQDASGRYVFACVNPAGGIDYLEFRAPLPHQCWFAGESLWYWDAVPLAQPGTYSTPTYSPSPSPSPTPTPTPTPTVGTPAKLVFTTQPTSGQMIATNVTFSVSVAIEDSNGNTETTGTGSTDSVTLKIGTNPESGVLACTDTGGLTVSAVAGVANFTGCTISVAGTGYTLAASDGTETSLTAPANANSFDITAASG
jgi:hypothetical protein